MGVRETRAALMGIAVYRHLLDTPVLGGFTALLDHLDRREGEPALSAWAQFFYALKQEGYLGLGDWLWDALRDQDSPYGLAVERRREDAALQSAARQDLQALAQAAALDPEALLAVLSDCLSPELRSAAQALPRWDPAPAALLDFDALTGFYRANGCGPFARCRAFRWEHTALIPIPVPDSPQPWELWGYRRQRGQVYDNARALLEGKRVNHVLLYGDSGTGKSATVKSLLSLPGCENLRLIEMDKDHLEDIPLLVRQLEHRPQKFVLFIDDLTFDADDSAYSQLKTILEGSLERRRDNVVVYATSNRRNLVRQSFSDRAGDDVAAAETIAEKTSLAERFGERVAFLSLTPGEFLEMVRDLAPACGLRLDAATLEARARQWELRHPGRTPRTAKQFIAYELDRQQDQ